MVVSARPSPEQIELTEHTPLLLAAERLPYTVGYQLWKSYGERNGGQVRVEFPTPRTENRWRLNAPGWVGFIPLAQGFSLSITPRVHLANLIQMWEYAYHLRGIHFIRDVYQVQSLLGFYERLADILARGILKRIHHGLYQAYLPQIQQLPYVRGRVRPTDLRRDPVRTQFTCRYEQFTADIPHNQILQFTLYQVARRQLCQPEVQGLVRHAYLTLQGLVSTRAFHPADCLTLVYNRLNQDYQPLHAICSFLLEHSGPLHQTGEVPMMPFLINMSRLYELFVAEWLQAHLPPAYHLTAQERVDIDQDGVYHFNIDLVLYHQDNEKPVAVLDTKYRTPGKAATREIAQVIAYAQATNSPRAILIYPEALPAPIDAPVGPNVQVRSLCFPLAGDLEKAGQQFLQALLADQL